MTMANVPDGDHIVGYVRPRRVKSDGRISGAEYCLRTTEAGLSVNWPAIRGSERRTQLNEVGRPSRLQLSPNGLLAEMNVGKVKHRLAGEIGTANIIHGPLEVDKGIEADPSHAQITDLPPGDSDFAMFIGDPAAECILRTYSGRNRKN